VEGSLHSRNICKSPYDSTISFAWPSIIHRMTICMNGKVRHAHGAYASTAATDSHNRKLAISGSMRRGSK
jgi:hypothetical protein